VIAGGEIARQPHGRDLDIRRKPAGRFVSVVSVEGPLEKNSSQQLQNVLAEPTESPSRQVVVDLTDAVLYDSSPLLLLTDWAQRFGDQGTRLVVVSGANPTVKPFVGDPSLPGLEWFDSLDEAMLELLGDMAKLGDWPPAHE
jgi:anti-anti-sigma regulatory factor